MENSMEVSKKLTVELPCSPAIPLLVIYLKILKTFICKGTFIAVLFVVAKVWKQQKCPSMDV